MAILPVNEEYSITATFGQTGRLWSGGHKGIDFVTSDREVYATTDGVVRVSVYDPSGWGNYISIGDANGMRHIYCHLERALVNEGDEVKAGDTIGIMGKTGNATGVHLHYQINFADGTPKNPADFLGIENKVGEYRKKVDGTELYKDDAEISRYAREAVYELKKRGIMVGDKLGRFHPKDWLTREQLAVALTQLLKEIKNG